MHTHYGLDQIPFQGLAEGAHYYHNEVFDGVLTTLVDGIASGATVLLLTGEPGTGKTALLQRLRAKLETFASVVLLPQADWEWLEFLDALYDVAEPEGEALSSEEKTKAIRRYLIDQKKILRTVLLIDNADQVDSSFLANLTALADSHATQETLLQIVLAGTPALDEHLQQAELSKFYGAIGLCCNLKPLEPWEVERFVQHELEACGGKGEALFSSGALDRIALHSRGLPRRIHMVCGAALRVAYEKNIHQVNAAIVEGLVGSFGSREEPSPAKSPQIDQLKQRLHDLSSNLGSGLQAATGWVRRHRDEVRETLANDEFLVPGTDPLHKPQRHRHLKTHIGFAIGIGCLTLVIWLIALAVRDPNPTLSETLASADQQMSDPSQYSKPVVGMGVDPEADVDKPVGDEPPVDQISSLRAQYAELKSLLEQAVVAQQETQQKYERLIDDYSVLEARTDRLDQQLLAGPTPIELVGAKSVNKKMSAPPASRSVEAQRSGNEIEPPGFAEEPNADAEVGQPQDRNSTASQSKQPGLAEGGELAGSDNKITAAVDVDDEPTSAEYTLTLAPNYTSPLAEQPIPTPVPGRVSQLATVARATSSADDAVSLPGALSAPEGLEVVIPDAGPRTLVPAEITGETVQLAYAVAQSGVSLSAASDTTPSGLLDLSPTDDPPPTGLGRDADVDSNYAANIPPDDDNATLDGLAEELTEVATVAESLEHLAPVEAPKAAAEKARQEEPAVPKPLDTDLVRTVKNQGDAMVSALLKRGAHPDARTPGGDTVLMTAATIGNQEIVASLLAGGARPDLRNDFGETALMQAAWHGHDRVVTTLLRAGTNLEAVNRDGWSALFYAAINGHVKTARALLLHGAHVNGQSHDGRSALAAAVWNGQAEVAETLLANGAKVNQRDADGWTPLMAAAWNGDTRIIQTLIQYGADDTHKSNSGQTALLVAKAQGHLAAVQLLNDL